MERDVESRAVADFLSRAEAGPAGLIIEGEAGIGKTTLVLDAVDHAAEQGFRVLRAWGSPAEVSYAYAAVADLLGAVDADHVAALPEPQRRALQGAQLGAVPGAPATDERMVANAFLAVIERMGAQAPVLLAIDDAQWLDASSRTVIGYLARRLSGRTGLLLSFRVGESDSDDGQAWVSSPRPEMITRVRMRPLTLGGVHALIVGRIRQTLPRPVIVRIHEISGGNPLFALELAATANVAGRAEVSLSATLTSLVRRRIGDANDEVAAVLLAAACAAEPTVELLAAATDMSTTKVVEALESVESLQIADIDGNRVRFSHPLFATGVSTDAAPSKRRAMHRRLAEIVEKPEMRARHLALAATTGDPETLAALDAAVEATSAQGAPAVAAELLELALRLDGYSTYRRIRAGELHFRAGSLDAAREHLQLALPEAPAGLLRAMALMWLAAVKGYDDDTVGAGEAMAEAAEEARDSPPLRLLCLVRLFLVLVMTDRLGDAVEDARAAVELADELGVPGLRSQARSIWVAGKFVHGLGVDSDSLRIALELEEPGSGATTWFRASAVEAMISAYTGELDRARRQMLALAQRVLGDGTEVDIIWAAVHLSAIEVWAGRYAEADEAAREAVQRAEQIGGRLALTTAWTAAGAAAAYAGRENDARVAANAAIDTAHQIGAIQLAKEPTMTLGFLEVSLGNYGAALDTLQPLLAGFDPVHTIEIEGGGHLPDAIEAMAVTGQLDAAEPLVDALERGGADRDRPWMLAVGARGRAHLLAARGELEAAEEAVRQALVHHERLPMPFEKARTQLLLGQLQRRRRHKRLASATLAETLEAFERLGSPLWANRARAELARLTTTTASGSGLTPAEERVARHAAAGLSNKEIAAELFLAPKTVEMTLSSVYRKLSIRSRAQLHRRLTELDTRENPDSGIARRS